ncbi:GDNF family receptor alpha-like isoform X1 [Haplochromis burtoni]|uniref:GDNF family receptor alpha-like isoform X1 n=1 Tax=Haplochromis burtoni TaxID=8153 RepID=UPI0003BD2B59|nr:GDNF family receptor alpha-like isoform X1 [Haplochromis burtoni]
MQLRRLEAAVIFVIIAPQISSLASECLAAVKICMSDLCKREQAFFDRICEDGGCQIKGSEVCNMTIQTILHQFPSLPGCVCAWEEELCDSIQVLATQCHQKPAVQLTRSAVMDWQSSTLLNYVYDGAGSCLDQFRACLSDSVCNRYLAPMLQACKSGQCNDEGCQQETLRFYRNVPQNVAEMLVMCECEASDQSCLSMKTELHSGTCGDEIRVCQRVLNQCTEDSNCRGLLENFQANCWSPEEAQCIDSDLPRDECFTQMDPELILGADAECKRAFVATLGTVLHHPCTCKRLYNDDLLTCSMIHDVLHNRSRFMASSETIIRPSKPPQTIESDHAYAWLQDYLLYVVAAILLAGVILMPLVIVSKKWISRKRDKTKFHHPQKSNCVVIL